MGLTAVQQRFVDEYTANPANAAEAARKAGYKASRAKVTACELIKHPKIAEAIKRQRAQIREQTNYNRDMAINDLLEVINNSGTRARDKILAVRTVAELLGLYPD
jgi:phage terminase small subunit